MSPCCHVTPPRPNKTPCPCHLSAPSSHKYGILFFLSRLCEKLQAHLGKAMYLCHKWDGRKETPSHPPSFCICSHNLIVTQALAPTSETAHICCWKQGRCLQTLKCAWLPDIYHVPTCLGDASRLWRLSYSVPELVGLTQAWCIYRNRCSCQQYG